MMRQEYEAYLAAFNARDYDRVFDFYHPTPDISFFGVQITTRQQLRDFYEFLHDYVVETVTLERFASSDELVALEAVVRVEGVKDLDAEELARRGLDQFFPIKAGDVQEMRQLIHYHLRDGKFDSVRCAIVA